MVELLGLQKDAIALHYYNWDYLGMEITDEGKLQENCSNQTHYIPDEPDPCGFDTHYGDYFPARVGIDDAVKGM